MSLSKGLQQTSNDIIDPVQKLKATHRLATAVLQYHSTQWLTEEWRLHDLYPLNTDKNLDNTLKSLHISAQFPGSHVTTVPIGGNIESNACYTATYDSTTFNLADFDSTVQDSVTIDLVDKKLAYGIENLTLFNLGVALLELGHWKLIQSSNDIIAARKLVERGTPLGPRYQNIVKRYLNCNFGFGTDLSKLGLQNVIYNDVVRPLEDMMSALDIGFD